jgi:hypothetical protein
MVCVGSTSTSEGAVSMESEISVLSYLSYMFRTMHFGRIYHLPKIKIISNLIDGLCGFHLNLGGRGIDGIRDIGLESDQDSASVRDPFPEAVVEVGVLVDQAVVPGGPVKVDKGGSKSW